MVKSPITRVGGKFMLAKTLISMFPEHNTYAEPFGGAAHVLFRKEPSNSEIYNDVDTELVNFFRVCADEEKSNLLRRRVEAALYARDEFNRCLAELHNGNDIDQAYRFAVVNKQSFGGLMETWGYDIRSKQIVRSFSGMPERIKTARERLRFVQIECLSFEDIFRKYDTSETFFYCDPPYPFTGERGKRVVYKNEMTDDDHKRLVDILLNIKGKVMLSGYDTPLYKPLEDAGWQCICIADKAISINKRKGGDARIRKREYVWINC